MPKIHASGMVTGIPMSVIALALSQNDTAETAPEEVVDEGGAPSAGTSSSESPRSKPSKRTTKPAGSRRRAQTTENH